MQSQRALLADQVELSTLTVHLVPFGVAPPGGPDGFLDGLATGWRALVDALSAAVVVLGVLLPWLALGALVTAAVLVPIRLTRRRAAVKTPCRRRRRPELPIHFLIGSRNCARLAGCRPRRTSRPCCGARPSG